MRKIFMIVWALILLTAFPAAAEEGTGMRVRGSMGEIYGVLKMPEGGGPCPLVILSHGFGSSHRAVGDYADAFVSAGYAAFCFDFCGGGPAALSDGKMTDMTVLTEAEDLGAVIDHFRADARFTGITLWGESQGGFVSAYVAGTRPGDVDAVIALYPALVLQDDARARARADGTFAETEKVLGMTIGRRYSEDAVSFDIYDVIARYPGPALILHGDRDPIVPLKYSERARDVMPGAELKVMPGQGHGFTGAAREEAVKTMTGWIKEHVPAGDSGEDTMRGPDLKIGGRKINVDWEDNEAVAALYERAAGGEITVAMEPYGGFEQVGSLGFTLPRNDSQTVTAAGDIVLYSGDMIVIFYGSNSWAYTRLGHISGMDREELRALLGGEGVTVVISAAGDR